LFAGCVMDVFYNDVNHACLRLLTHQRQIVRVPEQTCCGALAFHAGEVDIARHLAKKNIELLDTTGGEIIVTAAGCGAMLKNYPELFEDDIAWHERAEHFSARVQDITEFLSRHEFAVDPKTITKKVAYHAACHLSHAQNVRTAPEVLLRQIPGIELIALEEAEHCCGSAGIYNLTHTDLSMDVLKRKMAFLNQTGAELVVTTNPGCLLQIEVGIKKEGSPAMKACHIASLLDQAYQGCAKSLVLQGEDG
jgi:glycolate oxidase iron-sulfur subunit